MMVVLLCAIFAISASARIEDYNDTFTLKNSANIVHYEKWYYTNNSSSFVRKAYTDTVTLSFIDEDGNPLTQVPMWEYDAEKGKYYSLVWYISDYKLTWEDAVYEDANVGQQTYPKYTSAVYTLSPVRAVDLRFVFNQYNTTHNSWVDADGNKITYSLKSLKGIYHANGTPDDTSDDIRLHHAQGIGRDNDNYGYWGYDAQFEATGNKIVVGNFRDCDFQRDEEGNYGTSNTFSRADNLQCIWLPDTVKYWVGGGFSSCSEIDLGDGIEIIACQILRDNKKISTFRIPNSCIYVNNEAFRNSGLETLTIGENLVSVGGGSIYQDTNRAITYYLSKNILTKYTYSKLVGGIMNGNTGATIYFDGDFDDATALQSKMISNNSNFNSKITLVDYKTTTERGDLKNTVIFYNYNRCDAFYYGYHAIVDDKDCTTADNCTRECGIEVPKGNSSHANSEVLTYANGFDKDGLFCIACQNAGCEVKVEEIKDPIFIAKGYSTNDDKNALNGGFTVDLDALAFYTAKNGELSYGIVIANAKSFGGKSFFDENNDVNSDKSLKVEIDSQYSMFDCEINFGSVNAGAVELIICAYIIDGENVSFIQYNSGNDVDSSLIADGSFKSITLDAVIALIPPTSKEN